VQLGIWSHDAVYDALRNDNETRSALWASECLKEWGCAENQIARACQFVVATRHDGRKATDPDAAFLVDLDLAIFGTPPERYDRYAIDIQREYRWVPESDFRRGRATVLTGLLDRPSLYSRELWTGQEEMA
jgi:predicted metal-dependent HD superfamily phosphohydrolase